MAGRHSRPEPPAPGQPWYVWILLAPPLVTILFVLAGWWDHYRPVLVTAGPALSILSLFLQHRNRKSRQSQ
jgi:hypothetical protein